MPIDNAARAECDTGYRDAGERYSVYEFRPMHVLCEARNLDEARGNPWSTPGFRFTPSGLRRYEIKLGATSRTDNLKCVTDAVGNKKSSIVRNRHLGRISVLIEDHFVLDAKF